ncbi:unnamed protein product [Phyllotreta striolata]|uniref:N-acetyl-D-glucosamine kinase n=1 Tax=Phyllotreta striolata TaxID=444603 RepID=A0A9P0DW97_PHYSR|nr:unnamed protein product [Phyllotreta striolata]
MTNYIAGVEGGATNSHAIIMDSSGKILGKSRGAGTNHHLSGMKECRRRLAELINAAKIEARIPLDQPLTAVGLSLSGCEQEEANQELAKGIIRDFPTLAEKYIVASDTEGSVAATSNRGGVVCIAGTGSNTLLINPDGKKVQCGGWGNLLGDEGSAWKIAYMAVKYCFDELDNFEKAPYPTEKVWKLVKGHFKLRNQPDILDYFYVNFDKAYIASMTKDLSELAADGDDLAREIFRQNGAYLAKSIRAVLSKASGELSDREGGVHVTCVGSVWLSWELLKQGFVQELDAKSDIRELTLIRLNTEMGTGAVYLASDRLEIPLERDYSKNYAVLYNYKREKPMSNGY